jgi:hypothetical protein
METWFRRRLLRRLLLGGRPPPLAELCALRDGGGILGQVSAT